jgi:ribose 5-phosphate isomerase B
MAANKIKRIRAGVAWSPAVAKLTAQHNWCNVLCVPARFLSISQIKKVVRAWLKTPFDTDSRHERRVKKILKIESKS